MTTRTYERQERGPHEALAHRLRYVHHFADPLTPADRRIIAALQKSGFEVAAITLKRGHGWVLRGIRRAA